MTEISIDYRRAPLIVVTFPRIITTAQVHDLFERYTLVAQRHRRVGYVFDVTHLDLLASPGEIRGAFSDAFSAHFEVLQRSTVCEARVSRSTLLRAALNAFDMLRTQKWPCAAFATVDEGVSWAWDRMAEAGLMRSRT